MIDKSTKLEKALELAHKTREELGNKSLHMILLDCKTICRYLGIAKENEWIDWELNGYHGLYKTRGEEAKKSPEYRHVFMIFYNEYGQEVVFDHAMQEIVSTNVVVQPISELEAFRGKVMIIKSSPTFGLLNDYLLKKSNSFRTTRIVMAKISDNYIERILGGVTNRIHKFLDEIILELEYGKIPENIFEQIRNEVDKKLATLCPDAIEKLPVIYEQLASNKSVVYSQIASTCRTIIKDVADSLFPATKNRQISDRNNKKIKLDESAYLNRILTHVKKNIDSEKEQFLFSSMFQYVEEFLKSINSYASKGDHSKFTKTDATRCIVYTYLLLGDILHYYAKPKLNR